MRINYFGILLASMFLSASLLMVGQRIGSMSEPLESVFLIDSDPKPVSIQNTNLKALAHPLLLNYTNEAQMDFASEHSLQIPVDVKNTSLKECRQQIRQCTTTCIERP